MNRDVPVPQKIIIVGTSSVTLNERFSKLPSPPPVQEQATKVVRPTIPVVEHEPHEEVRRAPKPRQRIEELEEEHMEYEEDEYPYEEDELEFVEEIVTTHRPRPRPRPYRSGPPARGPREYPRQHIPIRERLGHVVPTSVPIEERVSFKQTPRVVQIPQIRGGFRGNQRGASGGVYKQNRFQDSRASAKYSNGNSRPFRGAPRGRAGSSGRGRGAGAGQQGGPSTKSQEQLDRELDAYMRKKKHPEITFD